MDQAQGITVQIAPMTIMHGDRSGATSDGDLVCLWIRGKASAHTKRAYSTDVSLFSTFLGSVGLCLRTTTVHALQDWIDSLTGADSTRARRIASVRSLLAFGQKTGYLTYNVGAAINAPKVRNELAERILTEGEAHLMMNTAKPGREAILIRFLYASGARVSEASGLCWKHVHRRERDGATITLHGKGGKTRHVPISEATAIELDKLRSNPDEPVFTTRTGKPVHPSNMGKMVRQVAKRAGLDKGVSPHWFRHAHASHALDRGCPIHVVQATLGHASLATTSKYVHVRPSESSALHLGV